MGELPACNSPTLVREKRSDILQIAARHGASNVRVFGSVARGEAGPGSDLDLLVSLAPGAACWISAASGGA